MRHTEKAKARIVFGVFAVLFLGSLLALMAQKKGSRPADAGVYQNGKLLFTIASKEEKSYRVETENGGYNVIESGEDGIRVTESSCPDHLCEQLVWKGSGSRPIVCLPNQLIITGVETEDDREIDAVTY